jgi:hypothetical protein
VSGCGCQTEICECGSPLHGWFLAGLTADEAAKLVFPNAPRSSSPGHNMQTYQNIVGVAEEGLLGGSADFYTSPDTGCAGVGVVKPALLSTVSGFALKFAPQAFAAGPIVGGIVLAIGALTGVFGAIFGHHAAAVKKERSVLCSAVPAANHSLLVIYEAVQSGQATPQQGIDALNAVLTGFESAVVSIRHGSDPNSSGECNAACELATDLHAIVLKKASEYQDLIDGAAQMVTPSRPNVVVAAGRGVVPASSYASFYGQRAAPVAASSGDWLPIAALVLAGFFFLRSV